MVKYRLGLYKSDFVKDYIIYLFGGIHMSKKYALLVELFLGVTLCGCNANIDANTIQNFTDTVNQFAESVQSIQTDVNSVNDAISSSVENINTVMEYYNEEAFKDIPNVDTPLDEEDVNNLVAAGEEKVNELIDEYVPEDAVYDVLDEKDMDFFTEFFNAPAAKGFLLNTYEKPESCDLKVAFMNNEDLMSGRSGKIKVSEDDVNEILMKYLGMKNKDMAEPLRFSKTKDGNMAEINAGSAADVEFYCNGGFYYNDIYAVMMCDAKVSDNFTFTVFEKISDEKVKIYMNYWSCDMLDVNWDGSMLYDLYDLMLSSCLPIDISDIDIAGMVSNIPVDEIKSAIEDISSENIEDVAKLVSSKTIKGKEVNTYLKEFEGYEVYYKDVLNSAMDEVEDFIISQIVVTGDDYLTEEGISVGDSKKDVIAAYGKGHEIRLPGGKKQLDYELDDQTIVFTINREGDVEEICIYVPEEVDM